MNKNSMCCSSDTLFRMKSSMSAWPSRIHKVSMWKCTLICIIL